MPFAARHRNDLTPRMEPLPGLTVRLEESAAVMAALQARTEAEIQRRSTPGTAPTSRGATARPPRGGGSPPAPPTSGSSARRSPSRPASATCGTSSRCRRTVAGHLPAPARGHRARGVARGGALLDSVRSGNHASGAGIRKAGFAALAELSFDASGRAALKGLTPGGGGSPRACSDCRRRRMTSPSAGAVCARGAAPCRAHRRTAAAITSSRSRAAPPDHSGLHHSTH